MPSSTDDRNNNGVVASVQFDLDDVAMVQEIDFESDSIDNDEFKPENKPRLRFSSQPPEIWQSIQAVGRLANSNSSEKNEGSGGSDDVTYGEKGASPKSDSGTNVVKHGCFKYKYSPPPTKYHKKNGSNGNPPRLTAISKMYDLEGDGVLDEAEQVMRDHDVFNSGHLTNEQIYDIVQEQLKARKDVKFMRKSIIGLSVFVILLALTNFATSWASAILAKDSKTDANSSTLLVKNTEEIMGLQSSGETFEMTPLNEEERRARRALVVQEMMDDPHGDDHAHRKLGKKNKKNVVCGCETLSFDSGKVSERDLVQMKIKCDGSRTVNIKRKWKDGSYDIDTLCRPGVLIAKKGPKNRKTKRVEYHFTYSGQNHNAVFACENGWCHGSGPAFAQGPNQPCDLTFGDDDCDVGLVCHSSSNKKSRTTGICIRLDPYQREYEACDPTLGASSCRDGLYCSVSDDPFVRTGICTRSIEVIAIPRQQRQGDTCDLELGKQACKSGLICYASRKKKVSATTGVCTVELRDDPFDNLVVLPREGEVCYFRDENPCAEGFTCTDTTSRASNSNIAADNNFASSASAYNGGSIVGPSGSISWNNGGGASGGIAGYNNAASSASAYNGGSVVGPSGSISWNNGGGTSGGTSSGLRLATGVCTRVRSGGL